MNYLIQFIETYSVLELKSQKEKLIEQNVLSVSDSKLSNDEMEYSLY